MPTTESADGTDASAKLIKRFRDLSEARGVARAHGLSLEPTLSEELASLEQRLVTWLASASPPTPSGGERDLQSRPAPVSPEPPDAGLSATIFTDGAADGNPGPGGYCAVLRIPGRPDRELSGGVPHTTNQKMELMAAIEGLRAAVEAGATDLTVISDSEYLTKGMTQWIDGWIAKNWQTSTKQPVKNRDLWEQLAALARSRSVRWTWVRGHAGHPENERCHVVASAAARQAARGRR